MGKEQIYQPDNNEMLPFVVWRASLLELLRIPRIDVDEAVLLPKGLPGMLTVAYRTTTTGQRTYQERLRLPLPVSASFMGCSVRSWETYDLGLALDFPRLFYDLGTGSARQCFPEKLAVLNHLVAAGWWQLAALCAELQDLVIDSLIDDKQPKQLIDLRIHFDIDVDQYDDQLAEERLLSHWQSLV